MERTQFKHVYIILDKTKKNLAYVDLQLFYERWSLYDKKGNFLKLDASAPRIINIQGSYYNIDKLLMKCCKSGHGSLLRFRNELERPINKQYVHNHKLVHIYHFRWD